MSARTADPAEPHPERPSGSVRDGAAFELGLEVCPMLRSVDASWSSVSPSRELRCWAVQPVALPTILKQRQLCVSARHVECPTFLAASAGDTALPSRHADSSLLWPSASPVPIALEAPHGRPGMAVPVPRTGGQALLVGLMLVAFVVLALAKTAPFGDSGAGSSLAPTASAAGSVVAVASASPSPTPSPSSESTPAPSPSVTPTVRPSPSPTASLRTYRVRSGDTLAVIAAKFHTTVKAIVAANKIVDPRTIHTGQILVIP